MPEAASSIIQFKAQTLRGLKVFKLIKLTQNSTEFNQVANYQNYSYFEQNLDRKILL